ncbi:hypothetical protein NUW54_g11110 [Trametes sanguinea]|uniref:Uncharacterized protein n=1 Tax=Trametes sanguinea TaxID=158606 RepID=A0ACC1NMC7_9APHY|nr:hypothetical protein NUW54_g11110 [Trametes sanguinea]
MSDMSKAMGLGEPPVNTLPSSFYLALRETSQCKGDVRAGTATASWLLSYALDTVCWVSALGITAQSRAHASIPRNRCMANQKARFLHAMGVSACPFIQSLGTPAHSSPSLPNPLLLQDVRSKHPSPRQQPLAFLLRMCPRPAPEQHSADTEQEASSQQVQETASANHLKDNAPADAPSSEPSPESGSTSETSSIATPASEASHTEPAAVGQPMSKEASVEQVYQHHPETRVVQTGDLHSEPTALAG